MRLHHIYIIMCMLLSAADARAEGFDVVHEAADSMTVERLLSESRRLKPDENMTLFFARKFIGKPYVAHTLEKADPERLVVNTRQLDCTTLVENVTALALCADQGLTRYHDFLHMLATLRYRNGTIDGYASRLHYFSEWIDDNTRKGLVTEVQRPDPPFTSVQTIRLGYMGCNPEKYAMLARHPELVGQIKMQEQAMTGHEVRYVPKALLADKAKMRKAVADGDIIAITCNKSGLDIAHVGFAVWKADGLHLLNASMVHKKVVEERLTLFNYMTNKRSFTGIRVVRINRQKQQTLK